MISITDGNTGCIVQREYASALDINLIPYVGWIYALDRDMFMFPDNKVSNHGWRAEENLRKLFGEYDTITKKQN